MSLTDFIHPDGSIDHDILDIVTGKQRDKYLETVKALFEVGDMSKEFLDYMLIHARDERDAAYWIVRGANPTSFHSRCLDCCGWSTLVHIRILIDGGAIPSYDNIIKSFYHDKNITQYLINTVVKNNQQDIVQRLTNSYMEMLLTDKE